MSGSEEGITFDQILLWQKETTAPIGIKQFPGNHFFIFNHTNEIMSIIAKVLSRSPVAPGVF